MISNDYFDFYWENPLKTYRTVKHIFRPLKPKLSFECYKAREAKILSINSFDVIWKDKYDTPRHEFNPRIEISIFNYFHIRINFTLDSDDSLDDMVYWEAILWWKYYNKDLQTAIDESVGWSTYNKETNEYEPMKFRLLKEPWQTDYENKLLKDFMYESTIR